MPPQDPRTLIVQAVRTSNALLRASRRVFKPFGITEVQFNVLNVLEEQPDGVSQRELSDILVVDRSNVTGLIDRMEKAGWVQRLAVPGDRRAYRVKLTGSGRRLWTRANVAYLAACKTVTARLPTAPRQQTLTTLETMEQRADAL